MLPTSEHRGPTHRRLRQLHRIHRRPRAGGSCRRRGPRLDDAAVDHPIRLHTEWAGSGGTGPATARRGLAEATDISGRISTAQTQQAKLEAEIADAEAKIPALRARAAELRAQVKARAAQLYVSRGGSSALESTLGAENAEDGLRAADLTDTIGTQDLDAARELC